MKISVSEVVGQEQVLKGFLDGNEGDFRELVERFLGHGMVMEPLRPMLQSAPVEELLLKTREVLESQAVVLLPKDGVGLPVRVALEGGI